MKRNIICSAAIVLFFTIVSISNAVQIDVDQIIWQPDPILDPLSLSAEIYFTVLDLDSLAIQATNTSTLSNPDDFPATVLLTGIGFNLPEGYSIISGEVGSTNLLNSSDDPSNHWGYDNSLLEAGPYQQGEATTLLVNTVLSTMQSSSKDGALLFGGGYAQMNGPDFGVLSAVYSPNDPTDMPYAYFDEYALITVNLSGQVNDWANFFSQIDSNDVVVGFGSPTAPIPVPEPSTVLLFGTGLIGVAVLRKKFRNK